MLTAALIALALIALGFAFLYKMINAPATYRVDTVRAMRKAFPEYCRSMNSIERGSKIH